MTNKKIIAIIGMAGSGKTEVINYLQKKYNWPKVYFGQATFDQLEKQNLAINYKNEQIVREKIRKNLGMGAYAKLALPKVAKILKNSKIVLIESLYGWDEYKIFKKKYNENFLTIAIVASSEIRLARLKNRKIRPIKTTAELIKRDYAEIEGTDKGGPIAIADYTIINDCSKEKLQKNINLIIKKIKY